MSEQYPRRYSEKEIALALRRAAELQAQAELGTGAQGGASREEIERIGKEVGIDPQHVAQALAELGQIQVDLDHRTQSAWLGAPPEYTVERIVPAQLTPETWQTLVGILNSEFRESIAGMVSGGLHSWQWKHELGFVNFTAFQTPEGLRLKLVLRIDEGLIAGIVPTVVAWFAIASLLFSNDSLRPWLSILFSAVALVGMTLAFRAAAGSWWRKDQRRTARLIDELTRAVTSQTTLTHQTSPLHNDHAPTLHEQA